MLVVIPVKPAERKGQDICSSLEGKKKRSLFKYLYFPRKCPVPLGKNNDRTSFCKRFSCLVQAFDRLGKIFSDDGDTPPSCNQGAPKRQGKMICRLHANHTDGDGGRNGKNVKKTLVIAHDQIRPGRINIFYAFYRQFRSHYPELNTEQHPCKTIGFFFWKNKNTNPDNDKYIQ